MPRRAVDEMTVSALNKIIREMEEGRRPPALLRVGGVGGLGLNVRRRAYASGEALSASWVLRRTFEGTRRDFALGAWPDVTLAQARERARGIMDKLWNGVNPTEERRATARAAAPATPTAPTFRAAAQDYFNRTVRGRINAKDEKKWSGDLESFVFPLIGDRPVDRIATSDILAIAEQPHTRYGGKEEVRLWESVPERAKRCLKKVEDILAAETRLGHRSGENPAAWRDHLSKLLVKPEKVKAPGRQLALPYEQLPAFMAALRAREASPSARALEFLILTAARSGEVREATWAEIDLTKGLWTIPAARMKAGKEHRVALPKAALAVLKATPRVAKSDLIWPGLGLDKALSDATLAALMKKLHAAEERAGRKGWVDRASGRVATPHGFRSTFRVWAAETGVDRDLAEMALAHDVGSAVERAYRRTDMLEKRRAMMEDWATFALGTVGTELRAVG